METARDKLARVRQMASDDGGTWDLSGNDQAALRHVLGLVDSLLADLAECADLPAEGLLAHHHKAVEAEQKRGRP